MQTKKLLKFLTCDLCDAHKNDTTGSITGLPPAFKNSCELPKFYGSVSTIKSFKYNSLVKAAVDKSGLVDSPFDRLPTVLVVDSGGYKKWLSQCGDQQLRSRRRRSRKMIGRHTRASGSALAD